MESGEGSVPAAGSSSSGTRSAAGLVAAPLARVLAWLALTLARVRLFLLGAAGAASVLPLLPAPAGALSLQGVSMKKRRNQCKHKLVNKGGGKTSAYLGGLSFRE